MPLGKFMLRHGAGKHIGNSPTLTEHRYSKHDGAVIKDEKGAPKLYPVEVEFVGGDVISSNRDYAGRWPEKFVRVADDTPASPGRPIKHDGNEDDLLKDFEVPAATAPAPHAGGDNLDSLTWEQLKDVAEKEEMSYGGIKTPKDLVDRIRKHRKALVPSK